MERYRVSLILAAADLDTDRCIAAYARRSTRETRLAFEYLLRRAYVKALWDSSAFAKSAEVLGKAFNLRLGRYRVKEDPSQESQDSPPDVKNMTGEQLLSLYTSVVNAAGVHVDPKVFMSASEHHDEAQ